MSMVENDDDEADSQNNTSMISSRSKQSAALNMKLKKLENRFQ